MTWNSEWNCRGDHTPLLTPFENRLADMHFHYSFECPECRYSSAKTTNRDSVMAAAEMHRHPVNIVATYTYPDGHEHREVTSPSGGVTKEVKMPDEQRPAAMPLRELLGTHIFTSSFGNMGLDNMPLGERTFGSIRLKKLGYPQASSMLENHYQMLMRQRGPQMRFLTSHVDDLISGDRKPTVTVKYNRGTPILVHGMTDLAVARKHLPDEPIKINYID
jgi:hypothetical protein